MFDKTRTHAVTFNGRKLEPVEVLDPRTFDDLIELVSDKLETEASICAFYHNAKAIATQAARRREQTSKSIPKSDVNRIFAAMDEDERLSFMRKPNGLMLLNNHIAEIYRQELIDTTAPEPISEPEDES